MSELDTIRDLLVHGLAAASERRDLYGREMECLGLWGLRPITTTNELIGLSAGWSGAFEMRRDSVVPWPRVRREVSEVPYLQIAGRQDEDAILLNIRVLQIRMQGENDPLVLCYRFEAPSTFRTEDSTVGDHNYWHMQLSERFGRRRPPTSSMPFVNARQPATPVHASSSVQLFLALIVALYGRRAIEFREAATRTKVGRAAVKEWPMPLQAMIAPRRS